MDVKKAKAPALGPPDLSAAELAEFARRLAGARNYLEFGAGGSSVLAAQAGLTAFVSVDSDPAWVDAVRAHPAVGARIAAGAGEVLHADIGPVGRWGRPADASQAHKWPDYAAVAFAAWRRRGAFPDLVLVDGRFRVACCLAVLHAAAASGVPAPLVLLHDFNEERSGYRAALEFYTLENQIDALAVLRARADVGTAALAERLTAAWREVR